MSLITKVKNRLKYMTVPRLWNRARAELDYLLRRTRVSSYPVSLIVEPCNYCNLKCPLCPTGQRLAAPRGTMSLETFRRIVDQLHRYVRHVNLFYLGEPLLCDDLEHMIRYAGQHKMKVSVSSNLNVFDAAMAERLIRAQLDYLIVSLDGTDQETYAYYRVGGDYDTVVRNVALLIDKKKELDSAYPRILIQFVIFRHNETQIPAVKELAQRLGVEVFFRQGALGGKGQSPPLTKDRALATQWLTQTKDHQLEYDYFSDKPYLRHGACGYLWKVVTINWDGSVLPCCWVYDSKDRFGNIMKQDFMDIWNNEMFQAARSLFRKKAHRLGAGAGRDAICCRCKMYERKDGGEC